MAPCGTALAPEGVITRAASRKGDDWVALGWGFAWPANRRQMYNRASADPARGGSLGPFDIVYARLWGASMVLLAWGLWLTWRDRLRAQEAGTPDMARAGRSLGGLSPLPLRTTLVTGCLGGVLYAMLAYSGFVFAPAAHASVLMPGSLPLWTALLAVVVLGDRIEAFAAAAAACAGVKCLPHWRSMTEAR